VHTKSHKLELITKQIARATAPASPRLGRRSHGILDTDTHRYLCYMPGITDLLLNLLIYILTCVNTKFFAVTERSHSSAGRKRPSFEDDEPDGGIIVEQPEPSDGNVIHSSSKPIKEDSLESDSRLSMHCICDSLQHRAETTAVTNLVATSCTDLQMMIKPEYYAVAQSDFLQVRRQRCLYIMV